jgi:hypothetical protein
VYHTSSPFDHSLTQSNHPPFSQMEIPPAQDARAGVELESLASNQTGTTEVDSLFNQEGRAIPDLHQRRPPHDRHGLIVTFILQLACFLWLVPIVTLLVFNFMPYVVGASAWCPKRKCNPGLFATSLSTTIENTERFDKQDHNLLGALQIVAKLLEIWFTLIAAAIVSKMTFWLARRKEGLPVELLTRPSGFGDLPGTLVEPLIRKARTSASNPKAILDTLRQTWKAILSIFYSNQRGRPNTRYWPIRIFVVVTAFLCIVCNLIGPAIAVLVLPTLRWVPTALVGDRTFDSMGAGEPPQTGPWGERDRYFSMWTGCTSEDFDNLSLSCATYPHASKLDSWIGTYIASGESLDGLSQEWGIKFRVNQTSSQQSPTVTWWVPCRQLLSGLDDDLRTVKMISKGYSDTEIDQLYGHGIERRLIDSPDTYVDYNNSLRLILERKGPVLGAIVQMHSDSDETATWTSTIDDERSIRCYRDYNLMYAPSLYEETEYAISHENFTKCLRVGSGWGGLNKATNFTIAGEYDDTTNSTSPDVEFSIFSSDKAQFFTNNTYPSWLPPECLKDGLVPSTTGHCDWERLFLTEPDAPLYNRTQNVTTIEMSTKQAITDNTTNTTTNILTRLTVDFVTFLNFTTYELDASLLTNPTALASTQALPPSGLSIHVDPAWMLAAWTVDQYSTTKSNRTATKAVLRTMQRLSSYDENAEYPDDATDLWNHISYISLLPIAQALSMVDYTTTAHSSTKAAIARAAREPTHPYLTRRARMYVWAYGINGRTSTWGTAVACIGILIVLAQTVIGFMDRRKPPGLDELLVAALEYVPRDDFRQGIGRHDDEVAKVHFVVQEKKAGKGQYVFERPGVVGV